ncbi:hypothetical protein [Acrocarpospora sp. B8E8]|uniref:helix-turn-helix domain-containing protein n=1 Tax=Acrocarpospora sp. B8E8 TaxID=3153572 RepID=UPI00325FA026
MSAADGKTLARMYQEEGLSIRDVARALQVSYGTARNRLLGAGVKLREPGAPVRKPVK